MRARSINNIMKIFKDLRVIILLLASAPIAAQDVGPPDSAADEKKGASSGSLLDGIAAIVNEGVVLSSEFRRQLKMIKQRAEEGKIPLPPANILNDQVLERLVVEEVQLQRAQRVGIQISDQMLNDAIANIAQSNDIAFEDLPDMLAKDGINYGDYRSEMRRQLTLDQLRRIDVMGRIAVSDREITQCLADIEDNMVVNSEYNLSHIFLSAPDSAPSDEIAAAEKEINDLYEQLQAGESFPALAARYSNGETALQGGALGWLKGEALPTLFFDVMDQLEMGDVSKPLRNVSGFHIVRVNELRSAVQRSEIEQIKVRHILIQPNQIIDDATAQQRLQDAKDRIEGGEEFGEIAKLLSDDPGSANDGGSMGWTGPGTFVKEFESVANQSEIGAVSDPFRSQFGWHILEVEERRTYDNTEDLKQSNCVLRIRNSKLASETEIWSRRLRDEAYVEKRI